MPFIDATISDGRTFSFCYNIATPTSPSAERIEPNLPCIFFIHSGYCGQEVFQAQFEDTHIRKSNLITMDLRGFADTTGALGDAPFTPTESAQDVALIMEILNLPPCHIFALSIGCNIALELTITHPYQVLSLTLCSPLSAKESEEVTAGRLQVFKTWEDMVVAQAETWGSAESEELCDEVLIGASELMFNHAKDPRSVAVTQTAMSNAKIRWAGSDEKLKEAYKTCIEWFIDRRPLTPDLLKAIPSQIPVSVIHCFEDIGYPVECATDMVESLQAVGLSVSFHEVSGTHYGNVTDPGRINEILYNVVAKIAHLPDTYRTPDEMEEGQVQIMKTPWSAKLAQYGYDPFDGDSVESLILMPSAA